MSTDEITPVPFALLRRRSFTDNGIPRWVSVCQDDAGEDDPDRVGEPIYLVWIGELNEAPELYDGYDDKDTAIHQAERLLDEHGVSPATLLAPSEDDDENGWMFNDLDEDGDELP